MQALQYTVTCDEFPDVIEEDSITYYGEVQPIETIASYLATEYMHQNIYDWEDDFSAEDLFWIRPRLDGEAFIVEFWSNSVFSNAHIPDHQIKVAFKEVK